MDMLPLHLPILFVLAVVLYGLVGALRRLFTSPIARFPGPKLAALTFWYEFYFDVWCQGRYSWKIQELHKTYGPVVRINPYELHVCDPEFYDSVYVGPTRRTEKWEYSARMFGSASAAVGTVGHELHRIRRSALNACFSKRAIANHELIIQEAVKHASERLWDKGFRGGVINLRNFSAAFTADIIGRIAFGGSYSLLDKPDFEPEWYTLMMDLSRGTHLMKQFPWAYMIFKAIPSFIVSAFHPPGKHLFRIRKDISTKIEKARESLDCADRDDETKRERREQLTVLHTLLTSGLPTRELQRQRLEDEAFTVLGAGTITTAHTITTILYHILAHPPIKSRLEVEVSDMYDRLSEECSMPSVVDLEHAPYLSAVVTEGLRMSLGVSQRLPRISPDTALHYEGKFNGMHYKYSIPPGVPVSMTQMFMHMDPTIYPSPNIFDPHRWLSSPTDTESQKEELKKRKRFFVPFSKGTRMCAGMHLAYAELYIFLQALFAPGGVGREMELFETSAEDVECVHDFFNPSPRLDSEGVRVVLRERGKPNYVQTLQV